MEGRGMTLTLDLAKLELAEDEAAAWHRDLRTARKTLKAPADKWPRSTDGILPK
jgi:hypothetical protein